MGRPPMGERAMTAAEKMRRYRARKFGNRAAAVTKPSTQATERLEARIRELEAELARRKAQDRAAINPARSARSGREVFSEAGRLRAEIGKLKSDIIKLKMMMLQEEPDAAKLRKKVVDQRVAMASMRREIKRLAKERDSYRARTQPKFREASRMATRETYNVIIKALHPDRAKHVSATEITEAAERVTALRPLFDED